MADLPETSEWTPGIYQLETSDPVLGGPEGVDNLAPKQLANRTRWLKDQIEKILSGASNVGKAVRLATARTISLTGAATGSNTFDGSANVAIALTLADSSVSAGSYTKVTVNAKGLVTAGLPMVAADVPNIDWSKINSGKPSTLDGYGITDAQPASANLSALAALSSTGLYVSTGAGTAVVRSIAIAGAGLSIANGNGVLGNPTLSLSTSGVAAGSYAKVTVDTLGRVTAGSAMVTADVPNLDWNKITSGKPSTLSGYGINDAQPASANLSALAALSSTGLYVSTGAGTALVRTFAVSGAGLSIANGNGVAGNPTLSLSASGVTAGSYAKVTVDALGRVTAGSNMAAADVPNLDWSKITTGKPNSLSGYGINDAYTKTQVDNLITTNKAPAATEAVAGIIEVATQPELEAGASDVAAVTPKKIKLGFAFSLGVNNYVALPTWLGGIIVQWGTSQTAANGRVAIVLPLSFGDSDYSVSVTVQSATGAFGGTPNEILSNTRTSSGFTVGTFSSTASAAANAAFQWFAIGRR